MPDSLYRIDRFRDGVKLAMDVEVTASSDKQAIEAAKTLLIAAEGNTWWRNVGRFDELKIRECAPDAGGNKRDRNAFVAKETPAPASPRSSYITLNGHHLSPDLVQTIAVALSSMDILNVSYLESQGIGPEVSKEFPERALELLEMMGLARETVERVRNAEGANGGFGPGTIALGWGSLLNDHPIPHTDPTPTVMCDASRSGYAPEQHPAPATPDIVGRYLRMHASWSNDSGVRTERVTLRSPVSIVSTRVPAGWEMRITGPGVYDALGGHDDEIEVTFRRVAVKRDAE